MSKGIQPEKILDISRDFPASRARNEESYDERPDPAYRLPITDRSTSYRLNCGSI